MSNYTGPKYSWFNPEAREWLRPDVEEMLLKYPSSSHLVHKCPNCERYSAVNNSTPFGIDQLLSFMIEQFQAAEAKSNMAYVAGLAGRHGLPYYAPGVNPHTPGAGEG